MHDSDRPLLENWSICDDPRFDRRWMAPELNRLRLQGIVTGHDKCRDGNHICTSTIVDIDIEHGFARTNNTEYRLGSPDPKWAEYMEGMGYDPVTLKKKS